MPTVRWASRTARAATSVERCAWPRDLADRGGKFLDRGGGGGDVAGGYPDPLLGGAGLGGDGIGSAVQIGRGGLQPSGGLAHPGQRLVDRHLEAGDGGGNDFAAVLARTVGFGLVLRQPLALQHGVAEHEDGARHGAKLVLGMGGGDARGGVAGGQPRHRLRQPVQGPRDAAPDQPREPKPHQNRQTAHQDNDQTRLRLRRGECRSCSGGPLLCSCEDRVRFGNELLAGVGNLPKRALDVLIVAVPLRQGRRVVLHPPGQLLLQFGVDRHCSQDGFEIAEFLEEPLPGGSGLTEPILRFLAPHGEKRQHQLFPIALREPRHAFVDGLFDSRRGVVEPLPDALLLRETHLRLLVHEVVEGQLELSQLLADQIDFILVDAGGRVGNLVEILRSEDVVRFEIAAQCVRWLRHKVGRRELHGDESDLEFATCVRERGRRLDIVERVGDVVLPGRERNAVDNKSDHGNQGDSDNAGPHRHGL